MENAKEGKAVEMDTIRRSMRILRNDRVRNKPSNGNHRKGETDEGLKEKGQLEIRKAMSARNIRQR